MRYLIALAALGLSFPAHAATTVFTEDFDSYAPNQVPWNGSGIWTTASSVDLVAANGGFGLTCVTGNCVDLTGNSPGMISRTIDLAAGLYSLTFQFTGNQLDGVPSGAVRPVSSFDVTFGGQTTRVTPLTNTGATFQTFTDTYDITTGGAITLRFAQVGGGDANRGSIIDSIAIAAVPEPATWALMILGFGIVGSALRRRRGRVTTNVSFA